MTVSFIILNYFNQFQEKLTRTAEPAVARTLTQHGRMACRIDYKIFSARGKKISVGCSKKGKKPSEELESITLQSDSESGEEEDVVSQTILLEETVECDPGVSALDSNMGTPELSPESSMACETLETISASASQDFELASRYPPAVTRAHRKDNFSEHGETPTHVVVSNLKEFSPSASAESILASTSLHMSFPTTSEAASILSSLEVSPGIDPPIPGPLTIEMAIEDNKSEECPENPIPPRNTARVVNTSPAMSDSHLDNNLNKFSNTDLTRPFCRVTEALERVSMDEGTHPNPSQEGGSPDTALALNEKLNKMSGQNLAYIQSTPAAKTRTYPSVTSSLRAQVRPRGSAHTYTPQIIIIGGNPSPPQASLPRAPRRADGWGNWYSSSTPVSGTDNFPQNQVIHDVSLSDAWEQKPASTQYQNPGHQSRPLDTIQYYQRRLGKQTNYR